MASRARRLFAEFLGTVMLTSAVVGSGIAAQRLSPRDAGLQLAENALATAFILAVLILVFAPISGAHLNPIVSLVDAVTGRRPWLDAVSYVPVQIVGCIGGAILANLLFGLPAVAISTRERVSGAHLLSEVVATAGLVVVIFLLARQQLERFAPVAVGAYIGAAYFFTSSTSFANPGLTIGRMFTNTFSGIAPDGVTWFIAAQLVGGAIGYGVVRTLLPESTGSASK